MKIAIDLTPLYGRKRTGVEMYAIDLYRALLTSGNLIIPIFHVQNELDDNPNAVIIPESNRLLLENIKLKKQPASSRSAATRSRPCTVRDGGASALRRTSSPRRSKAARYTAACQGPQSGNGTSGRDMS